MGTIYLTPKTTSGFASISSQLEKQKTYTGFKKFITSPKTTLGLSTVLGGLLGAGTILKGAGAGISAATKTVPKVLGSIGTAFLKSPVKTTIVAASVPTALGLATTPEFRQYIAGGFKRGQELPTKVKSAISKVKEVITPKTSAAAGLGAAAGGLAIAGAGALKEYRESKVIQTQGLVGVPTPVISEPLGTVQKPVEEKKTVKQGKPIKINNEFNPTINIRYSRSKKFINQQNYIK